MRTSAPSFLLLLTSVAPLAAQHDHPKDDCAQFYWDMTRELELLLRKSVELSGSPTPDPDLLVTADR